VVEWADRFPTMMPIDHLRIDVRDAPDEGRIVTMRATGPRHARMMECLDV
jgi:tRNA A37 threonylcarbamoyladenosine biosynthesis protein TsaE